VQGVPSLTLRLSGGEGEATQGRSELLLETTDLLAWDNWKPASRGWLESQTDDVSLGPLIVKHSQLVYDLNIWLLDSLAEENRSALAEANKIIEERNAWFNREPALRRDRESGLAPIGRCAQTAAALRRGTKGAMVLVRVAQATTADAIVRRPCLLAG